MSNEIPSNPPANTTQPASSNTGGPAPLHQVEHYSHGAERQKTELEKWATDTYNNSQVLMDEQGNRIMLWASLILLLLAAIIFYNRSSKAVNETSWQTMFMADTPAKYKDVAQSSNDSVVGALASLKEGDSLVFAATENMFKDRETSKTELSDAKKAYDRALKSKYANDDIKQRAELGLATIIELQSTGDLTTAIKAYDDLAGKFPDTAIGIIATDRVKQLKNNQDAVAFYKWFAEQNPKPPVRIEPKDQPSSVPISPDLPGSASVPGATENPASTDLIPGMKEKPVDVTPDFLKSLEKLPKVEGKTDVPKTDEPGKEPAITPEATSPVETNKSEMKAPPAAQESIEKPETTTKDSEKKIEETPKTPETEKSPEPPKAEEKSN